jgi:hypothetical protein
MDTTITTDFFGYIGNFAIFTGAIVFLAIVIFRRSARFHLTQFVFLLACDAMIYGFRTLATTDDVHLSHMGSDDFALLLDVCVTIAMLRAQYLWHSVTGTRPGTLSIGVRARRATAGW